MRSNHNDVGRRDVKCDWLLILYIATIAMVLPLFALAGSMERSHLRGNFEKVFGTPLPKTEEEIEASRSAVRWVIAKAYEDLGRARQLHSSKLQELEGAKKALSEGYSAGSVSRLLNLKREYELSWQQFVEVDSALTYTQKVASAAGFHTESDPL